MKAKLLLYIRLGMRIVAVAACCSIGTCVERIPPEVIECLRSCNP